MDKTLTIMNCDLIELNARIRRMRIRLARSNAAHAGEGIYVYTTNVPNMYIRCFGELNAETINALGLKVFMRNLKPFKPLAVVN